MLIVHQQASDALPLASSVALAACPTHPRLCCQKHVRPAMPPLGMPNAAYPSV